MPQEQRKAFEEKQDAELMKQKELLTKELQKANDDWTNKRTIEIKEVEHKHETEIKLVAETVKAETMKSFQNQILELNNRVDELVNEKSSLLEQLESKVGIFIFVSQESSDLQIYVAFLYYWFQTVLNLKICIYF